MRKGTFKDLTGSKFGKLTVVGLAETEERQWKRQKATVRWYLVRCECGKEKTIAGPSLTKDNRVRSCGCLLKEYKKTLESRSKLFKTGSAFRRYLLQSKSDAKRRGYVWELTDEQFRVLTSSPCHYTGALPFAATTVKSGETYVHNGIDRLDNTKGYTVENCVPCCSEVNYMKRTLPYETFLELCRKIAERCANEQPNNQSGAIPLLRPYNESRTRDN
jgi:hypothetical protein